MINQSKCQLLYGGEKRVTKVLSELSKRCFWVVRIFVMSNHLEQFAVSFFTFAEFERLIPTNSKIFISQPYTTFYKLSKVFSITNER